ncbi:hypothetical protein AAFF_G00108330 [Aldrovandia affinis]|uniref:KIAA0232 n=1 Tax=Aldrovandia affinis TaxID=143900 RepID=A0AAD7RTU6_9TELE|nr:hypothetical protein AAFF_G00108330 [Aldrovandia affinis]
MRPVSVESDGPAPESYSNPLLPGPLPASEMSLLHSLGPVQSWLGQELEKCGIDAMIYTRYVLSLLLHDSYDYDMQDQENDIFLGWEKGTGKKWGKSKKKGGTDLSVEEMKKQAAVQCLRSASDENSGIESLVEELCSKLKDIQNKQKEEKQANKKSDGSQSPELDSPSSKDQVEMYYEAFPPLSEKPVCLQEIMTVWNKAKACAYSSSSSSAAPQTSTDTSSPKDCNSEGEAAKDKMAEACSTISEKTHQRRSKKEKENRFYNSTAEERAAPSKRQTRHRSEGKFRPRSWSSGSSEAGSSSSGNQGESKTSAKSVRIRHKSREASRSKRGRNGQVKLALKAIDKEERRNVGGSSSSAGGPTKQPQLYKKGKRPSKELRKDSSCGEAREPGCEVRNKKEYMEEPLWYTEPITEYFVPFSRRSKLETKYRNRLDSPDGSSASADVEKLSERMQGICIANSDFQRAYLAAEQDDESKPYNAGIFTDDTSQQSDNYSSGIIKDIWTAIGDRDSVLTLGGERPDEGLFPEETSNYPCCCLDVEAKAGPVQGPQKKAVQRSEYHLWEGQKEEQGLAKNELSKVDGGDYMTPSKPWDMNPEKDNTFILGGVYGELKTFGSDGDGDWAVVPPGDARGSLLQCAAASDVVTIAGTDVFMNTGSCFAPGHKPLWRPLVSFGQRDQAMKGGGEGLNKGFSFIFHEDLLGTCGGFHSEEPGLDYPFSSFDLNNPFSQVLHVECSFEPEDIASFSPGFKPKSILCSDSESETFHPRIYGINRTQYRAIRISPRTHFRPISASELSPGGGSESDAESEKEEMSLPVLAQADVFDDPQADLKPLEEDAECEGPYYGKSELESGKFLPRLKKSGMEKSAQTSLDSQEGSSALLPIAEQEVCLDCEMEASVVSGGMEDSAEKMDKNETCSREKEARSCSAAGHNPEYGKTCDFVEDLQEFPVLDLSAQGSTVSQQGECWWQNTLCSPLFPGSQCTGSSNINGTASLKPEATEVGSGASWTDRVDSNLPRRLPTCSINVMAHTADGTKDNTAACGGKEGARGAPLMENGTVPPQSSSILTAAHPAAPPHRHDDDDGDGGLRKQCSLSLPSYRPTLHFSGPLEEDQHSLASQDSGIPTLEINNPEHIHARPGPGDAPGQGPATLVLDASDSGLRKSSTFPRSGPDVARLFSPGARSALNRSDDISVCSVSSLSTELSATLSVSNEDILDFMVTSDSSAIVTLETDDTHFSDITLSSPADCGDLWSPRRRALATTQEEGRNKRLGPLASFFTRLQWHSLEPPLERFSVPVTARTGYYGRDVENCGVDYPSRAQTMAAPSLILLIDRSLFARKVKEPRPPEQREPGWKLFGKVPLRDGSVKDPRKIQKGQGGVLTRHIFTYLCGSQNVAWC